MDALIRGWQYNTTIDQGSIHHMHRPQTALDKPLAKRFAAVKFPPLALLSLALSCDYAKPEPTKPHLSSARVCHSIKGALSRGKPALQLFIDSTL